MDYYGIRIHPASGEKREILASLLAEEQFESFMETENELLAYIQDQTIIPGKRWHRSAISLR